MDLQKRISSALDNELSRIYDELGIVSGDISPLEALEWDEITAAAAELFARLIKYNK